MANTENQNDISESVRTFALLYKHKIFIFIFTFTFTVASVVVALYMPVQFKSTVNVVPPNTNSSLIDGAMGSVSSALKNFGLTKLSGGSSGSGYNFNVILESRSLVDSLIFRFRLDSIYEIPDSSMSDIRKTLSGNMDIKFGKEGNYAISFWDEDKNRAANMANEFVSLANQKAARMFKSEADFNLQYMKERMQTIETSLSSIGDSLKLFSRENLLFSPEEQGKSLSKSIAELKAQKMKAKLLYDMSKGRYGEDDPETILYKNLLEKMDISVREATDKPGIGGNFSLHNAAGVSIKYAKLYTEFKTFSKVKAILLPMLEKAKLDVIRSTKNLFVVDSAIPADKKNRPKRSLIVLGAFIGAFVTSVFIVLIIYSFKEFNRKHNQLKNFS